MNKSEYGHKPIKTESTGGKAKSKPTTEKEFKVELTFDDGTVMVNRKITGYTPMEVLGLIEMLREDVLAEIRTTKTKQPTAREKGDDML